MIENYIKNQDRVERIISKEPERYEAYLYEIKIVDTDRTYVGFRSKPYDGTYIHSSKCEIFAADLGKAKKIIYKILEYGTAIDMATKERKVLKEVDAKNNPKYYNKSNGGGKFVIDNPFEKATELFNRIKNGELDEYTQNVPITELMTWPRIQVRGEDDSKHEKNIKDQINDNMGSQNYIDKNYRCYGLENYRSDGKHTLLGGNHTRFGVSRSIVGKTASVPTTNIPKFISKNYSETELLIVGNLLNGRPETFHKPTGDLDLMKLILTIHHDYPDISLDSTIIKEHLRNEYHMTSNQITGLIKKIKKEYFLNKNSLMGKVWIEWTSLARKNQLQAKLDEHRDKNTFTMVMSSGKFDWNKIIACVEANYEKKKNFILYIHHPLPNGNTDYEREWTQTKYPMHSGEFNIIFKALNIQFKVMCLPTLESDGSNRE